MSARGNRREFLADVGRGMLIAAVGSSTAAELGLGSVVAGEEPQRLTFGPIEPLVTLMEETSPAKLVGLVVDQLKQGTELKQLVAAAALANARTFGGEDYVGFHTMMAFAPAFHMARELPQARQPLPVIKVLYRNTSRIQESGGRGHEVLHPVAAEQLSPGQPGGEACATLFAPRTWMPPRRPSRRWPVAVPTRLSTIYSSRFRTIPKSTARSCPIARGICCR